LGDSILFRFVVCGCSVPVGYNHICWGVFKSFSLIILHPMHTINTLYSLGKDIGHKKNLSVIIFLLFFILSFYSSYSSIFSACSSIFSACSSFFLRFFLLLFFCLFLLLHPKVSFYIHFPFFTKERNPLIFIFIKYRFLLFQLFIFSLFLFLISLKLKPFYYL